MIRKIAKCVAAAVPWTLAAVLLGAAPAVAAGGAFAVDDAAVDEPGACKVESWMAFASNQDFIGVISPACVANLGRPVELGVAYQRSRADGEWGSTLGLKAKTNIIPVETGKIGVGFSIGVPTDLLTRQITGFSATIPLTFQVSEMFKLNANLGWLYERTNNHLSWLTWGAGFEWQFVPKLTLIGEAFGQLGNLPMVDPGDPLPPNSIREPRVQAGLRFTPVEALDLDLIFGRNITGENASWVTLGANIRF
jgi:hypothetical protein